MEQETSTPPAAGVPAAANSETVDTTPASAPEVAAESQSTETPTPPATAEKTEPFAKRFAALSHKERELRARQTENSRRESELKAREDAANARLNAPKPKSAIEALKSQGFSYQDAALEALGMKEEAAVDPVEQRFGTVEERLKEVDELKRQLHEYKAEQARREQEAYRSQVKAAIGGTVSKDTDKYEFLAMHGEEGVEVVLAVMEEWYAKNNGEMLSFADACDRVENHYTDQAKRYTAAKKLQPKATPPAPTKPVAKGTPTIKNDDGGPGSKTMSDIDFNKLPHDKQLDLIAKQIKFLDE